jgi:hypothetical protein
MSIRVKFDESITTFKVRRTNRRILKAISNPDPYLL